METPPPEWFAWIVFAFFSIFNALLGVVAGITTFIFGDLVGQVLYNYGIEWNELVASIVVGFLVFVLMEIVLLMES